MRKQTQKLIRGERSLEFFNGQYVMISRDNGRESYKFLSPAAVASAFRNAPLDSGWLTPGIVRCGSSIGGDYAVLFVPAQKHKLPIEETKGAKIRMLSVPLPSLVFFGIGKGFSVWAVKESQLIPSAQLFKAPLPNVFANGSICWGANRQPMASAATIQQAWQMFITSPFNGHAATAKTRSHQGDVRGVLRGLSRGAKQFPAAELVRFGDTIDNRVNRLIGGTDGQ